MREEWTKATTRLVNSGRQAAARAQQYSWSNASAVAAVADRGSSALIATKTRGCFDLNRRVRESSAKGYRELSPQSHLSDNAPRAQYESIESASPAWPRK